MKKLTIAFISVIFLAVSAQADRTARHAVANISQIRCSPGWGACQVAST